MTSIPVRSVSAKEEELLNRQVQKLNGLSSKTFKLLQTIDLLDEINFKY